MDIETTALNRLCSTNNQFGSDISFLFGTMNGEIGIDTNLFPFGTENLTGPLWDLSLTARRLISSSIWRVRS